MPFGKKTVFIYTTLVFSLKMIPPLGHVVFGAIFYFSGGFDGRYYDESCKKLSKSILQCTPDDEGKVEFLRAGTSDYFAPVDNDMAYHIEYNYDDDYYTHFDAIAGNFVNVSLDGKSLLSVDTDFEYKLYFDYEFLESTGEWKEVKISTSTITFPANCETNDIVATDEPSPAFDNLVWLICYYKDVGAITNTISVYQGITSASGIDWTLAFVEQPIERDIRDFETFDLSLGKVDASNKYIVMRFDHFDRFLVTNVVVCRADIDLLFPDPTCFVYYQRNEIQQGLETLHDFVQCSPNCELDLYYVQIQSSAEIYVYRTAEESFSGDAFYEKHGFIPSYNTFVAYDDGLAVFGCILYKTTTTSATGTKFQWYHLAENAQILTSNNPIENDDSQCTLLLYQWNAFTAWTSISGLPVQKLGTIIDTFPLAPTKFTSNRILDNQLGGYSLSCGDIVNGNCNNTILLLPPGPESREIGQTFDVYFTESYNPSAWTQGTSINLEHFYMRFGFRLDEVRMAREFSHSASYLPFDPSLIDPNFQMIWLRIDPANTGEGLDESNQYGLSTWCMFFYDISVWLNGGSSGSVRCSDSFFLLYVPDDDRYNIDSYTTQFYLSHNSYSGCTYNLCWNRQNVDFPTLNGIHSTRMLWFNGNMNFLTDITILQGPNLNTIIENPDKKVGVAFSNNDVTISETAFRVHHALNNNDNSFSPPVTKFKYGMTGSSSFPDSSAKITIIGGETITKLFILSATLNSTYDIDAPSHRVCMGQDFSDNGAPSTVIKGMIAVYALRESSVSDYSLDVWYITEEEIIFRTEFTKAKTDFSYSGNELGIICNQGQFATDWRLSYYPIGMSNSDMSSATHEDTVFGFNFVWVVDFFDTNAGKILSGEQFQIISQVESMLHKTSDGVYTDYFASLGYDDTGVALEWVFCAQKSNKQDYDFSKTEECFSLDDSYEYCSGLSLNDVTPYIDDDDLSRLLFETREVYTLFFCNISTGVVDPDYWAYNFDTASLFKIDSDFTGTSVNVCSDLVGTPQCADAIGIKPYPHDLKFDFVIFSGTEVYAMDFLFESGTIEYPKSSLDTYQIVAFPRPAVGIVYFDGWRSIGFPIHNFSIDYEVNILPEWMNTSFTRIAVSASIESFKIWNECQYSIYCQNNPADTIVEIISRAAGPTLDDPTGVKFYLYREALANNATLQLIDAGGKTESNIISMIDSLDRNVLFLFSCDEGVPFNTFNATVECNGTSKITSRFDGFSVLQLQKFRLDQTLDESKMYCFGSDSVTLGKSCGQHPIIHSSSHDCGAEDSPFVCVLEDEIFDFDTVFRNVSSDCISMSGTCYKEDEYTTTSFSHYLLQDCLDECIADTNCVGVHHSPYDCKLFAIAASTNQFFGTPCVSGTLGYMCRSETSGAIYSTEVIVDPQPAGSTDPDFFTNIKLGTSVVEQIIHGYQSNGRSTVDMTGHETHFIVEFTSTFNTTGGTIVYICGPNEDDSKVNVTQNTVLFSHPASEDQDFINVTEPQCYVSNANLSIQETKAVPAEQGFSCFIDRADSLLFYGTSFDDEGKQYVYKNFEDVGMVRSHYTPPSKIIQREAVMPRVYWKTNSPKGISFSLAFARPPGKTLHSVVSTKDSARPYGENEPIKNSYWHTLATVPIEVDINDIRPVILEDLDGATSQEGKGSKGSETIDFSENFAMFQNNGAISDVLWGRFMNYKSYFAQTNKYNVLNETDFIRKYVFSMSEAFSSELCPDSRLPPTGDSVTECVVNRMTRPVMNPLFSEVLNVSGRQLALGFTPYRVSPFMGVYLDCPSEDCEGDEDKMMVMPDDEFIQEHGGIGFGAASTTPDSDSSQVYSFGGLDYSPNQEYRHFEKLPFDMPAPLQWHPVWARSSQTFGCKEEATECTYKNDFYDNVVPQTELGTARHKLSVRTHVVGYAHSPDEFYHYFTPRNFQFPSYRESQKCGPGDVTVNLDRLEDVDFTSSPTPIDASSNCGREFKMNLPFTTKTGGNNVDFSVGTDFSASQLDEFKYFMRPAVEENNALTPALAWMFTRKLPYYNKLWSSLLSLSWFNSSHHSRSTDSFRTFSQECISRRSDSLKEHYGSMGAGRYHTCTPISSGGTTLMAINDKEGDSDCKSNNCATALSNDCKTSVEAADFTSRYSLKGSDKQVATNVYDPYADEMTIPTDFDLYDPSQMGHSGNFHFWTDENAGNGKAALFKLEYMESDIAFLARECLMGQLALIKFIPHFDYEDASFSKDFLVYKETFQPQNGGFPSTAFNLSKVFSVDFWKAKFEALHTTVYLGHNNDHLRQFCREHVFGQVNGYDRRMAWTSGNGAQPSMDQIKASWAISKSKFKFPSGFVSGNAEQELPTTTSGPTCSVEMCLSPYPALLPPFKMNCDFVNQDTLPDPLTEWRTCPMMPNPDFYAERGDYEDSVNGEPFFSRQIWRPPAFWHNKENVWNAKAFR